MTLADLSEGEKGIITKVRGRGAFRKRIIEMGFIRGKDVEVIKKAPLRDPIEYHIMGYNVSLRKSEAALIDVVSFHETESPAENPALYNKPGRGRGMRQQRFRRNLNRGIIDEENEKHFHNTGRRIAGIRHHAYHGVLPHNHLKKTAEAKGRIINVALVGNPNSGKTTLFNYASGSRERVGNYSGVTVGAKVARFSQDGYIFNIVDLPGTYSITAYTPEELFVRNYIQKNTPDVVINILDASNLERNMYLTTQLIDMDIRVVAALNMYDEMEKNRDQFDYEYLGKMIGIPFVPTVSSRGKGIQDLFSKVIEVYEDRDDTVRHIHINYGHDIERAVKTIQDSILIPDNLSLTDKISSRFLALKLLERDRESENKIFQNCKNYRDIFKIQRAEISKLETHLGEDTETLITDAKYGFISGALKETYKPSEREPGSLSERIDNVLTHRILGFPIFLLFMWLTFELTFTVGQYPMNWIDSLIGHMSAFLSTHMSAGILKDLIVDGAIAGVGGVIIFLPNILILFFMISLMEDTGYMARAAFIVDKLMHKIGLHGKSFIPLIMGFGCNVPAVMATRTLESRNDRLLTMLIIPFMSCSARLPVYVLLITAFFAKSAGTILFGIYLTGALVAVISAKLMKNTLFRESDIPFVMELPPYRWPRLRATSKHMWEKGVEYLKKIAGIVLVASILIWALGAFPKETDYSRNYDSAISTVTSEYKSRINTLGPSDTAAKNLLKKRMDEEVSALELEKEGERLEKSYIGRMGHAIEPVMRPLGFDWKMSVSIITGLAAKEVVVGTMGVLYSGEHDPESGTSSLIRNIKAQVYTDGPNRGSPVFTPLVAATFILFILLYFPCVGVIAAIRRESGSWKWAMFAAFYTTAVAWVVSFIVYNTVRIFLM